MEQDWEETRKCYDIKGDRVIDEESVRKSPDIKINIRGHCMELVWVKKGKYYDIQCDMAIDEESVGQSPVFEGKSLRKVILRKKPKEKYFVSSLDKVKHTSSEKESGKDRGHLIADMFKNYLLTKDELEEHKDKVQKFFGIGNKENVTLQSKAANRNSKEYAGQLGFEQKIKSFLDNSSDGKVYFEIEEMYLEEKLGRRIYIKFIYPERDDIHVFILDDR